MLECALDSFGNYSVQDVIEAAFKLRMALESSPGLTSPSLESFKREHEGQDPAGALLRSTLPHSSQLAVHPTGTYVMQKLVENCSPWETLDVCSSLFNAGPAILGDPKGIFTIVRDLSRVILWSPLSTLSSHS